MEPWLRVEFHCHTHYSKDSLNKIPALLERARICGLDRLIITDHNTIRGAQAAQQLDPERVIIGEEILTDKGELLAAYVTEEIPARLPVLEVITRLRKQGAFISVSHPFDRYRGWSLPDLIEIVPLVDAVETFNSRCVFPADNASAERFARQYGLDGTVGSDAHILAEVARATLRMPHFNNAAELRTSIRQAEAQTRLSGWEVHLASSFATNMRNLFKNRS